VDVLSFAAAAAALGGGGFEPELDAGIGGFAETGSDAAAVEGTSSVAATTGVVAGVKTAASAVTTTGVAAAVAAAAVVGAEANPAGTSQLVSCVRELT
jgi:hypothetical protein